MSHTPGPWEAKKSRFDYRVVNRSGDIIVETRPPGNLNSAGDEKENAHLIAAAPDLLAILQTLVEKYHAKEEVRTWQPGTERHDIWAAALAAITKATSQKL